MHYHLDFAAVLSGEYRDWLISGIVTTLELSAGAWLIAFVLGLALAVIRMAPVKPGAFLVAAYVEYHQNTPILVQIFFWYFAVPELLPLAAKRWINGHDSEFMLAMVALGCCFAAYMSEALRSGLRAVPNGQLEAARALGFGYLRTMRLIVLPQAVRIAVPPLLNHTLLLFKNSSLAVAVGVAELTYQARAIETETFRTFEAFAVATAVYLAISFLVMGIGAVFERRMRLG